MITLAINENITAIISDETQRLLDRDNQWYYLDSLNDPFCDDVDWSDFPDWYWSYRPIEVITMVGHAN